MTRFAPRAVNALYALLLAALLSPLVVHAYNGSFSRFIADDYCAADDVRARGVLGATLYLFGAIIGRYSQALVYNSAVALGPGFSGLLPALVLAAWLAALVWAAYQAARLLNLQRPLLAAALASAGLAYAALDGSPALIQSLYWTSGVIPYLGPLILLTLLLGALLRCARRDSGPLAVTAAGGLAFAAGGFSEPYLTFQGAALALLAALAWFTPRRRALLPPLLAALAGTAAALFIVLVIGASGNATRQLSFTPTTEPAALASRTAVYTAAYFAAALSDFMPAGLLAALATAALVTVRFRAPDTPRLTPRLLWLSLGATAALAVALIAAWALPGVYATSALPPGRAYVIPSFGLALAAAVWGGLMALGSRPGLLNKQARHWGALALAALLAVGPVAEAVRWLNLSDDFAAYAAAWDARHSAIVAAAARGEREVHLAPLPVDMGTMSGLENVGPDANGAFNACAARYYGLDALAFDSPAEAP
ncbi:MAG: DUF6056 family protein [Aggregatilineales bacterium]